VGIEAVPQIGEIEDAPAFIVEELDDCVSSTMAPGLGSAMIKAYARRFYADAATVCCDLQQATINGRNYAL